MQSARFRQLVRLAAFAAARRRAGARVAFTLLEILIVIALLGVLAYIVLSNFDGSVSAEKLRESATRMEALVAMCRAQAMNEARTYRMQIRQDGTVRVLVQRDPITAPNEFTEVPAQWARLDFTMDTVWVDRVQQMPDGPAPVLIDDDVIEFTNLDTSPRPITEFEKPVQLDFAPDGSAPSLRWILRDVSGHGIQLTFDGRLGRIERADVETLLPDDVQQPAKLPPDEEAANSSSSQSNGALLEAAK